MNQFTMRLLTGLIGGLLLLSGCGKDSQLQPVEGAVTLDGKPVEGATVSLLPVQGLPATGLTDSQGHFTLSTIGEPGCKPGTYAIIVTKLKPSPDNQSATLGLPSDVSQEQNVPTRNLLPKKYAAVETSGLKAVVDQSHCYLALELSSR